MRNRGLLGLLLTGVMALGCASTGGSPGTPREPARSRDVITAEELAETDAVDAYSAVQRLRPSFFQTRGATSLRQGDSGPVVYIDNSKAGSVGVLRQLTTAEIKEIRYLSASEATQRFGTGYTGGAILVTRK